VAYTLPLIRFPNIFQMIPYHRESQKTGCVKKLILTQEEKFMDKTTFNEIGNGFFFYLPNYNRCIRIANITVETSSSTSERVNYYNFATRKFGYLSGMETVLIRKNSSRYVLSYGIEH